MEANRIAQSGLDAYLAALEVAEALNEREVTLAVQTFFVDEREALLSEREARLDELEALLERREASINAREERAAEMLDEARRWFDGTYAPDIDAERDIVAGLQLDALREALEDAQDASSGLRFGTLENASSALEALDNALEALAVAVDCME